MRTEPEAMGILLKWIYRTANPVVRRVLCSRFHWPLSRSLVLLEVTGRRSGKLYQVPVSYVVGREDVMALTYRHRQWWRNIESGTEIPVYFKGQRRLMQATVVLDDLEAIGTALQERSLSRKLIAPAKPKETAMIRLKL